MPRYRVEVSRTVYRVDYADIEVDAENPKAARVKVRADFNNSDFYWLEGDENCDDGFEVTDVGLSDDQPEDEEVEDEEEEETEEVFDEEEGVYLTVGGEL